MQITMAARQSATFAIGKATSTTVVNCPASVTYYSSIAQTPCTATVTGTGGLTGSVPVTYFRKQHKCRHRECQRNVRRRCESRREHQHDDLRDREGAAQRDGQ